MKMKKKNEKIFNKKKSNDFNNIYKYVIKKNFLLAYYFMNY